MPSINKNIEVILLKDMVHLGPFGETVRVRRGYARNYLLPQGFALPANKANLARFEERRAQLAKEAEEVLAKAQARAQALSAISAIEITVQAGEAGRLFGSIGPRDVVSALSAMGHAVDKHEVLFPAGVLRELGDHPIQLRLHTAVEFSMTVRVHSPAESTE